MQENRIVFQDLLFSSEIEGGLSDRPLSADPGGLTMGGFTQAVVEEWRGHQVTRQDMIDLSLDERKQILAVKYWKPAGCNELIGGLDISVCDFGFNSGVRQAVKVLQRVLGFEGKDVDGFSGPKTANAAAARPPRELIIAYHDARLVFLKGLKNWPQNAAGWTKRCRAMCNLALTLAPEEAPAAVARTDGIKRHAATIAATVGAAIPVVVSALPAAKEAYGQVQNTLGPFAEIVPWLPTAAGALVMIGVVWLAVRNSTMAHNATVVGSEAAVVAAPRMAAT